MGSPAPIAWASWMVCSCSFQPLYGKTKHVEKPCDNMESQGSSWTQPPSCAFKGGRHSRHVSKALLDPLTCPSPSWITSNDLHMEQKNHLADPWITQIPDPWNYEQEWYGGGFKSLSLGCFVTYQWIRNKHCRILWLRLRGWNQPPIKAFSKGSITGLTPEWHRWEMSFHRSSVLDDVKNISYEMGLSAMLCQCTTQRGRCQEHQSPQQRSRCSVHAINLVT